MVSSGVFRHLGRHAGHDGRSDQSVSPSPAVRRRALVGKPRLGLLAVRVGVPVGLLIVCVTPAVWRRPTIMSLVTVVILTCALRLPFYYAGIAITLVLTKCRLPVARVYASDLCGASLGCFLVLGGLKLLDAPSLILLCGAIGAMAGFFFLCGRDTSCGAEPNGTSGDPRPPPPGRSPPSRRPPPRGSRLFPKLVPLALDHASTIQRPRRSENGTGDGQRAASASQAESRRLFCLALLAIVNSRSSALVRPFIVKAGSCRRRPGSHSSGGTLSPRCDLSDGPLSATHVRADSAPRALTPDR